MDFRVKILNWEKYNPKSEKKCHWFRMQNDVFTDSKLIRLNVPQMVFWFYLLAERSRSGKEWVPINTTLVRRLLNLKAQAIINYSHVLKDLGLVETDLEPKVASAEPKVASAEPKVASAEPKVASAEPKVAKSCQDLPELPLSPNGFGEISSTKSGTTIRYDTVRNDTVRNDTVAKAEYSAGPLANAPVKKPKPLPTKDTSLVWKAYSDAYEGRYGERPITNAKGYGMCKQFLARVPAEEACGIASFYLTHTDAFYVKQLHPFGLLLKDAEKLRTEWKLGRQMTSGIAKQTDLISANQRVADDLRRQIHEGNLWPDK